VKRPDRFSQSLVRLASLSAHGLRWTRVTVKPVRSGFAVVVARVESLRGRMGETTRQVEGLFESMLSKSFGGRTP